MTAIEIIKITVIGAVTLFVLWILFTMVCAFIPAFIQAFRESWKKETEKRKN